MLDRVYEITYTVNGTPARILLNYDADDFRQKLRVVEQALANSHAEDIVYLLRKATAQDVAEIQD